MRRYLTLILVLSLLLPCLVVPASASDANIVDAIQGQTQTLNDYLYSQFQDLKQFLENYFSIWSSRFVNIQNYLSSIYGYFTDDTYGTITASSVDYSVTHFQYDLFLILDGPWLEDVMSYFDSWFTPMNQWLYQISTRSQSIYLYLEKIFNGDSSVSDSVEDKVNQDSTEASEYLDIMDDVTKPDVGELEDLSDISGYVNAGDVSVLAACLSPFFQSAIFLPCIMLSLIFMLVAYVLYGKR